MIKQFWLAKKSNKQIAYYPVVDEKNKRVDFVILQKEKDRWQVIETPHNLQSQIPNPQSFDPSQGTVTRGDARCLVCSQVTKAANTRRLAREGKMGERMVAVVLHRPKQTGKCYRLATADDVRVFNEAAAYLEEKIENWPYLESPLPEEKIPEERKTGFSGFRILLYGLTKWKQLFNARQQLALVTFKEKIRGFCEQVLAGGEALVAQGGGAPDADELVKAVMGYLATIFDMHAAFSVSFVQMQAEMQKTAKK